MFAAPEPEPGIAVWDLKPVGPSMSRLPVPPSPAPSAPAAPPQHNGSLEQFRYQQEQLALLKEAERLRKEEKNSCGVALLLMVA